MIKYDIKNETILEVGSKKLDFKYKIVKVLEVYEILIIVLGDSPKIKNSDIVFYPTNGIYAVSSQGDIIWNIEVFFRPSNTYKNIRFSPINEFTDAIINDDGNLVVYINKIAYILDIEKKEIIGHFETK